MANKTSEKYYIFNHRHLAAVFGMQTEMCGSQHIPACNSVIPWQKRGRGYLIIYVKFHVIYVNVFKNYATV
jgi:hypothetical protein